ncbi:STAS domain-containing protein [Catellatospora citrea]|uniref:STAS domain-containing protein n=1 Tax=Catellatospora citrea TaxID=53366 RepID=UPI0011C3CFB7|nr:STAS domain-containing protein [Catellatospora citrea]
MEKHPMTITVTCTCQGRVARMRIAGDVDLMDAVDVSLARDRLAGMSCQVLFVDLAGVTFGGSALVHYLYALSARLPGAELSLCGASGLTTQIIKLTGLDQVAVLRDTLPPDWATAGTSSSERGLSAGRPALGKPQPAT